MFIRLQDNVPQVNIEQSRDFQLFCRLYDCINNGVMYDVSSMLAILDPMKVSDRMLSLLCTKIGFFANKNYDSKLLRYILVAFPYAMKYKGSKQGIKIAVSTILKAENDFRLLDQDIDSIVMIDNSNHSIQIFTTISIINQVALKDFLSYILPVGYTFSFETFEKTEQSTIIWAETSMRTATLPAVSTSQVRGTDRAFNAYDKDSNGEKIDNDFNFKPPFADFKDLHTATISTAEVIGASNLVVAGKDTKFELDRNKVNRDTLDKSDEIKVSEYNDKKE